MKIFLCLLSLTALSVASDVLEFTDSDFATKILLPLMALLGLYYWVCKQTNNM
jgi:hypothetical protein